MLNHYHITAVIGKAADPSSGVTSLLMEYLDGGDLHARLKILNFEIGKHPNEAVKYAYHLMRIAKHVSQACEYLEEKYFIHRDIAARNVLLTSKNLNEAIGKIGDFGMARYLYRDHYYHVGPCILLPIPWCAPETLSAVAVHIQKEHQRKELLEKARCAGQELKEYIDAKFSKVEQDPVASSVDILRHPYSRELGFLDDASLTVVEYSRSFPNLRLPGYPATQDEAPFHSIQSDVWSYGVLLWEMLTYGSQPFAEHSVEQIIQIVAINGNTPGLVDNRAFPHAIQELMSRCWKYAPHLRPRFQAVTELLTPIIRSHTEPLLAPPTVPLPEIPQLETNFYQDSTEKIDREEATLV